MTTTGNATFSSGGSTTLYEQWWRPDHEPRAVLAIIHGYAEHGGRYEHVALFLNGRGYAVEAVDLRGHGRSSGPRASVDSFEEYLDDVDAFLVRVRDRNPGKPLFLLGHSMGGGVVTAYLIARQPALQGALLSGSALLATPPPPDPNAPPREAGPLPATTISRDPAVVAAYENDPLVYRGAPSGKRFQAWAGAFQLVQEGMEKITLPLLIMHGTADLLTAYHGSEQLYARAASRDKTLKLYEGLYHEIVNEPEKDRVMADMATWLDARSGPGGAN